MSENQTEKPKWGVKREGAGRKKTACKSCTFKVSEEVIRILEKVPNKTAFVVAAVVEKARREGLA